MPDFCWINLGLLWTCMATMLCPVLAYASCFFIIIGHNGDDGRTASLCVVRREPAGSVALQPLRTDHVAVTTDCGSVFFTSRLSLGIVNLKPLLPGRTSPPLAPLALFLYDS